MLLRGVATGAAFAVGLTVLLAGCASYEDGGNDYSGNGAPAYAGVEDVGPDYEALADEQISDVEVPQPSVCSYAPSYDHDWHNDVTCTNGADFEIPYLREWDTFIKEDEIMESAREYEDQLNTAR